MQCSLSREKQLNILIRQLTSSLTWMADRARLLQKETQGFVNIWQNHEHGPSLSQTNTDTKKLALTDTQTHIFRTVLFPVFFGTGCESQLTCSSCSPGRINPFGLIKLSCVELLISSIDFSSSPLKWKIERERQRGRKRRRI